MKKFLKSFPSENDILTRFSPANWARCLENQEKCFNAPCVLLKHTDKLYNHEGLAKLVVKNNMIGLYSASTANNTYKDESMNIISDLFVAKHGGECNLYALMLYFANYIAEYKSSYQAFDMQDVLQQFGKKFLPWWRSKRQGYESQEERKVETKAGLTGRDAMIAMLGTRLINGQTIEDIKNCNLYKVGFVKEKDLKDIIEYAENNF